MASQAEMEKLAIVSLGGETFSILEIPGKETSLVVNQQKEMIGSVNLPVLVDDLNRVGKFLRVAYNGVAGFTELQIKVRGLSYDFTKLCNKSSITVSQFREASCMVLDNLQGTYGFLMENLEDMALVTLGSIEEIAEEMAVASKELAMEFEKQSERTEDLLNDTCWKKDEVEKEKVESEKMQKKYEAKVAEKKQEVKEREEERIKKEEEYEKARQLQRDAEKAATSPLRSAANAIFKAVTLFQGDNLFDTDKDASMAETRRKEVETLKKEMQKERDDRREALSEMMQFTALIASCKNEQELQNAVIPALDGAKGGMKKLSVLMLKISGFWNEMKEQCKNLSSNKTKQLITTAMKMPEETRLKLWGGITFKKQAMGYYGKWVAMKEVCSIYKVMITNTQRQLYDYLGEHYSTEESRKLVQKLAIELQDDLARAQTKIDEKNAEEKRLT